MSDLKFSCPKCGQHLSGDAAWAGRQIQCPACQQPFVISASLGIPPVPAHAMAAPVAAGFGTTPPPPPPPRPPLPPAPPAGRAPQPFPAAPHPLSPGQPPAPFSNLSLVAFILSLVGIALPAVICGHIALGHFKRQPGLRGRGFAVASLVIGYVTMALLLLLVALAVPAVLRARKLAEQHERPGFVLNGSPGFGSPAARPRPPGSFRSGPAPQLTQVTTDPQTVTIPAQPVAGTVNGAAVTLAKGRVSNGVLTLSQNDGFGSDYEVTIFLFLKAGETLAGRTFLVPAAGRNMNPHVHARFSDGQNGSSVYMVMDRYAMRLEFGEAKGNTMTGRIYLELPPEQKTKLSGTFEVRAER